MTDLSIDHGTFTLEQHYKPDPARVWRAFSDPDEKRDWFTKAPGFTTLDYRLDFRTGGSEYWRGTAPNGAEITNSTRIAEARPEKRLIQSFEMTIEGRLLSASVLTIELAPDGTGTRLKLTEQVAHIDGLSTLADRRSGTGGLLRRLGAHLGE